MIVQGNFGKIIDVVQRTFCCLNLYLGNVGYLQKQPVFPFYTDYIIIVGRTEMKTQPNSDGGIPEDVIDSLAQDIVVRMSPLQRGKLLYPHARPVAIKDLPQSVLSDHMNRYTSEELRDGQFFEVLPERFTFIMGNEAYDRRNSLKRKRYHEN